MKTLTKETWRLLRQNLVNILLFELLYRGILMPSYLRLSNKMLRWTLSMAGYSYLTAGNAVKFLARPWTLFAVLSCGFLAILLLLLEAAALITAFQGAACGQRLTPFLIFWRGLHRAVEETGRRNWRLVLVLAVHYFLVNLLVVARCLSHIRPLNFVIQEILSSPWLPTALMALLAVCVAVALPTAFVCFGCVVEQQTFSASLRHGIQMLKGRARQTASLLVAGNLVVVAAVMAAYALAVVMAAVCVTVLVERDLAMAVLLSVAERIEQAALFVAGIFLVMFHFAALTALYHHYGGRKRDDNERRYAPYSSHGIVIRAKALLIALALMAGSALYGLDMIYHRFSLYNDIFAGMQITAHRGSSKAAPENTMAALTAAVEEMADWVEMDVQMTKDEVVVLSHDASLKRVAGIDRAVSSMTWEELQLLDVGSWFSPEFDGEKIPSLEEAMEYCRGKINLNIEIKNVGRGSLLPEKVANLILDRGMEEQCVVTSTSLGYLEQVKALAPQLRTGYIVSAAYGDFYSLEAVDFISIRASFVTRGLVERIHAQGKAVHAWTVNAKSEMERMRLMGVDNVITDYPVLAREIIYREEATETLMEYLRIVF